MYHPTQQGLFEIGLSMISVNSWVQAILLLKSPNGEEGVKIQTHVNKADDLPIYFIVSKSFNCLIHYAGHASGGHAALFKK